MEKAKLKVDFDDWRGWVTAKAKGRVLEIGAGDGVNFEYYDASAHVVAFDPELYVEENGHHAAKIELMYASAEDLPFPDASFDAAVGTLVFCTIPNAARALAEVRRVLKPDAPLRLVEHVRAKNPLLGVVMDVAAPIYKPLAGGCHLNRDTESAVRAAGFEILGLRNKWGGILLGIDAKK